LKIETVALEDQQTKVIAELDAEILEKYKRQAARKISQHQKFPGFRPGKAPYDMVRRVIGDEALIQEAVELMLDEVYPKMLQEAGIQASGPGKLEEIVRLDPPTFAFVVPLPPSVDLGEYKEIRKDYEAEPITDEQVDSTMRRLQRSYSTAEPVERPAQKGDMVAFKLTAKRTQPAEGEDETLVAETPYQMVAGEEDEANPDDIWPYQGFTQELLGLSAGDNKTVLHTFDEESPYEDLHGIEASFTIEVQNVKEMHLPELNDDFAQMMGEFEDMEALRKTIHAQLEQNYSQQFDQKYFEDLIDALVEQAQVKYPPHMLEEEMERFVHGVEHNLEHERLDLETYLKMRDMNRETFMETEVKPAAERRLRRSLVLEEFARVENVSVRNEEIESIYFSAMRQMEQSAEAQKGGKNRQNSREIVNSLAMNTINSVFNQRILSRLKAIATGRGDEAPEELAAPVELLEPEEALQSETVETEAESGEGGLVEEAQALSTAGGETQMNAITSEDEAAAEQEAAEADLLDAAPPQADLDSDNRKPGESEA
jgi:trigger factor